jgi:hypothetical protein
MDINALNRAANDFYNHTVSSIQENIGEFVQSHFDNDPVSALKSLIQLASAAHEAAVGLTNNQVPTLPFQTK